MGMLACLKEAVKLCSLGGGQRREHSLVSRKEFFSAEPFQIGKIIRLQGAMDDVLETTLRLTFLQHRGPGNTSVEKLQLIKKVGFQSHRMECGNRSVADCH